MATRRNRAVVIFFLLFLLVVVLAGTSIYFYKKANSATNPADSATETKELVTTVGKIAFLPDETPTIATVSDPSKLSNQAFFADAKKGDKVLIYTSAKKAVLYDPVAHKIVNMAPIDLGSNTPGTVSTPTTTNQ